MSETRTLLENIGTALYYADGWQLPVGVVTLLRDCKSALEQAERSEPAAASVPLPNCICPTTYAHGMIIPIADGDCPRCFPKTAEAPEGAAPAGVTAPIDPIYFMSKMLEGLAAGDADKSLAYARHYIEQLEASGSASQAKRLRDAMDGTARMVGLAAPAGAHCNDCTDPHCHGAAPAVSREASVPLLIDQLADRLEDWAQNEEMIDQFFLGHGKDCNEAAKLLRALSSAPGERR
jgi:hypothetical protein